MKIVRLSVYARDILEMIPNAPVNLWESGLPFLLLLQKCSKLLKPWFVRSTDISL